MCPHEGGAENNQGKGGVGEPRTGSQGVRLWATLCLRGLPANMSWPAAPWLPPLPDLARPGCPDPPPAKPGSHTSVHSSLHGAFPCLAPLARSAFFPSLPLKMALCGPLPGVFSTVFLCGAMQGPPICLTSIYSFPSYLRCFLLQEAFPDSPPLFYFHRQFAAPCCKFP